MMASTPLRSIRVPDAIWERARERAAEQERSLTEVIREFLIRYGWHADETD